MDKSTNPYADLDLGELAQACDERAGALQAMAWSSEAERTALREATAELLSAVAQQLSSRPVLAGPAPVATLSAAELNDIISTHVQHLPLSTGGDASGDAMRHAWVEDFVPGAPAPR